MCKAKGVYLRVKPRESIVDLDDTKGWAYGVAEKGSDWLGSFDWASYQGSMNGIRGPDVQQGLRSLMGKVTHLCRV